jgi:hypothetical protein
MRTIKQMLEDREQRTGKSSWLLRQARAGEAAELGEKQPWTLDYTLDEQGLRTSDGRVLDVQGATARIETEGELRKRVTATRLVALGLFALAARKKVDSRTVYLTIDGPNVAEVREYQAAKLDHVALRQFVASINSLAQRG